MKSTNKIKFICDKNKGAVLIGYCFRDGLKSQRDIVRRLMRTCKVFSRCTFEEALGLFRSCERHGWVKSTDEMIKVYFDYGA